MNESHLIMLVFAGGIVMVYDAVMSIVLYLHATSYRKNEKQTWGKDHIVRLFRLEWGVFFIIAGWILI